MPKRLILK